ncbi:MAG TPA: GNAT family N-acetyltransferase [Bacteroidales bacterium]|jgi:hypothetical protein|nr:GNAT family N-acetyltransferase [Bacteroidales bacterium]
MLLRIETDAAIREDLLSIETLIPLCNNPCLSQIVSKTFGWETVELVIVNKSGRTATVHGNLVGRKVVLLPHFSYGPSLSAAIAEQSIMVIKQRGYSCEWRLTAQASQYCITSKVSSIIRLSPTEQSQFEKFDSNLRRKIRKCNSNGIKVRSGSAELLDDFYRVYSRRMHQLGSPVLAKSWFSNLLQYYKNGEASIWCAYFEDQPAGAAFVLGYQGFYEACWFATLKQYNRLYVAYGLTWAMLRHAIKHSGSIFSLGRSSLGSSVHYYKQQWGIEDVPLYWNLSHSPGTSLKSFTFISRLWKLIPYTIATKAGPWFAAKIY